METLNETLKLMEKECVAIIGSGGKTSLLWYLTRCYQEEKVLVGPTTKMGYPIKQPYDYLYLDDFPSKNKIRHGISVIGSSSTPHKLASAPLDVLSELVAHYDKIILESDGSKQLPLKGWAEFEPVIIPETSTTIAILPIKVFGQLVSKRTVHRISPFTQLTGLDEGELIDEATFVSLISHPKGIWHKAQGRCLLLLNQVETQEELNQAKTIVSLLSTEVLHKMDSIIACSIENEVGEILWER